MNNDWTKLRMVGDELDALQSARIRSANRMRRHTRGMGLDVPAGLRSLEDAVAKMLRVTYREVAPKHLRDWQKAQLGLGDLQFARFLGHLGHPRIATPMHWIGTGADRHLVEDPPFERSVSQLVAYCGRTGDHQRRKRTGMSADEAFTMGKPSLKMISYLIAGQMVKAGVRKTGSTDDSDLYDIEGRDARSKWAALYLDQRKLGRDRLDWTLGHQHAAALHRVAKAFVQELWEVAGDDPELPALREEIAAWTPPEAPTKSKRPKKKAATSAAGGTANVGPSARTKGRAPSPGSTIRKRTIRRAS